MKTQKQNSFDVRPIGVIRSKIKERSKAPKQGSEGAQDAWLEVRPFAVRALDGLANGDEIIILTWLHRAHRDVLRVHRVQIRTDGLRECSRHALPTGLIRSASIKSRCAK
jgi:tRNA (Thr-GGU) A37 N-methylase